MIRHKIQTNWKRTDSPNITHNSWGFFHNGKLVEHPEECMFEGPPWEFTEAFGDPKCYENSVWGVHNCGAWYTIDSYNEMVDVIMSY